jgi:hypothetical protein
VFWVLFEVTVRKTAMSDNEMQLTEKADAPAVSIRAETWHALLEIAGRQIDPETAEVCSMHRQVVDPYGVYPDPPDECDCVGRCYFARAPGSRMWIEFGDLPEETREALWMRERDSRPASIIGDEVPLRNSARAVHGSWTVIAAVSVW